jgi:hypothetical protein
MIDVDGTQAIIPNVKAGAILKLVTPGLAIQTLMVQINRNAFHARGSIGIQAHPELVKFFVKFRSRPPHWCNFELVTYHYTSLKGDIAGDRRQTTFVR